MSTTNKWLIGIGIVVLVAFMYALPFILQSGNPVYGSGTGMMGGGMMRGSGMMDNYSYGYGLSSIFMWVFPISLLTLMGLGIAALIKYLRSA